ncbi:Putative Zn-dependent protease, contains TPR repeats [Burkholderia sp. YR290]|jgi:predicted Zn-dependent protease|uniref:M48 family metalloprotease n=1 Tax=Paraburkholderia hospita TaxID=169430 RepID=UPI0009A62373|nr:M48 family metalloprotease [Paraburkholderia hospita]SKC69536.1 Putative Zn-dependent protease, contains TPR repeats [Burkholderia sp. CF099]SKC79495.1 Putative Zn-dependent protease, contains TPR repeats [Paraburkholderia hospita]SOE56980.1 Putative Zn-dependent protease, contains TPR repeats [Burkholderia sp. YR290]
MRLKRFLAALLSVTLAVPPAIIAQPSNLSELPLVTGPLDTYGATAVPPDIAQGVFGLYGGAQSRFSGNPGGNASLRAPMSTQQLPDLGDGSGGSLTPQAERKLGERVMREVRADPDYIDDWLVRDYLNSISEKLAAAASAQFIGGYRPDFDLFAMRDAQINAFSLPGGFIGVNTGLIVATQTESELASVVGHEMGHVLQRHIARMITAGEHSGYAALAGMLLGVLAGVLAHSGDLGSAIAIGGQAYAVDNQLRFSRAAEHEADRVGFQMLAGAGYDPYGMVSFFERLDRASMSDAGAPAYARTHPLTGERIADMSDRARRSPYRQPRQSSEYTFVRARARVLQDRSRSEYADDISRMRSEIEDRTALNVAGNWYGIAYAQMLLERYDDASASLATARSAFDAKVRAEGDPSRSSPSLDVLAVDIARRAGRNDEAVRLAETAQKRWPQSHAAIEMRLQTLLTARRFGEAQAQAQRETRADPQQPVWWRYLAQASVGTGDALTQHRALAEKFALEGAWPSAIRQLKEARDIKSVGYYDLATIDARLHEFEARYKEEREDEKNSS